jgi:Ca2+-transporting ATPase
LVVGDLLSLNPGMSIPADGRLLKVDRLSVDESTMTGESLSVYKEVIDLHDPQVPLADRKNMVYRGTTVTGGNGLVLIVAVGANTEIGKIQRLMTESTQPQTPLEKQLNRLGNQMTGIACVASFAIFIIGMMRGARTFDVLKTGISMAVAAIPEALPTVATTTLARGIKNLETNHILVRHLEAMETLASVDVVCLDKTGTLTMNDMEVVSIVTPRGVFDFTLDGLVFDHQPFDVNKSPTLQKLIQVAALCNEATVSKKNGNNGSSTETALITMAMKLGKSPRDLKQRYPLISTRYRSESQHYMTTVHQDEESKSKKFYAVKGAPAQVVALCGMYRKKNKIFPMTEEMSHSILSENEKLAQAGLRVLGFAYGTSAKDLIWVGLVAMRDPIRVGIKELVPQFHEAGIETIMITGDQAATARAIGNSVGIKKTYARVTPSKKLKIVKSLQKSGKVVAMIGDGVNDGPALKAADVGIVMAAQGSEVTSQVADIVLPTNNIIGLVSAIQEGRTIHQDIKKAVDYIIAQNMSEIIFTFVSVLMGHGKPFSPAQFLWVNLVTDIFPELALAQEPPEKNVLRLPPGDFQRGILVSKDIEKIIFDSLILSTAPLGAYLYFHHRHQSEQKAKSMAFITMTASSLFYTLSARSENVTIFDRKRLARNNYVPMAIGAGFSAEYLAAVTPTLQKLLEIQDLTKADFLLSTLGSLFPFFATELVKLLRRPRGTQTPAMSA